MTIQQQEGNVGHKQTKTWTLKCLTMKGKIRQALGENATANNKNKNERVNTRRWKGEIGKFHRDDNYNLIFPFKKEPAPFDVSLFSFPTPRVYHSFGRKSWRTYDLLSDIGFRQRVIERGPSPLPSSICRVGKMPFLMGTPRPGFSF